MSYAEKLAARGLDPTKIDLSVSPTSRRMSGRARHGDTPFDVPFISEIFERLWQGGCANGLVLPSEIENLVVLYHDEAYSVHHELRSLLSVVMYDSTDQGFEQIDAIASWVNEARKSGPTLVHCQAGLNRSGLVVARSLMLNGFTADAAIETLRRKRSPAVLCNPAFEDYLRAL